MDLGVSEKVAPILESVRNFINVEVLPLEQEYKAQIEIGSPWEFTDRQTEILDSLKLNARAQGLWNFFLTDKNGTGLNTVEYAYLAEEMGRSYIGAEVFNCSAPIPAIWKSSTNTVLRLRRNSGSSH